ncbi:MAG: hypothetical protein MR544_00705, partial [Parabacteroides sp.]|nr:hypothetical protein [Parabacteroides sp.]
TKRFLTFEHKGTRIFLITKGCSKKKMLHPIFLNNGVGLRDESATFLHNFACSYLYVICKSLTICVFAGLTRKLILCFSNATRCVPTLFIDRNAGSAQRKKCTKIPGLFHGDCSTKVNVFVEQSGLRESPYFPPFPASLQRSLPAKQEQLFITYY